MNHRDVRGFTLLELLVVLALMAVIAVVALPRLGASPRADVEAAARTLAAGLRQARSRAVTTGRSVALTVDLGARRMRLDEAGEGGQIRVYRSRGLPDAVDIRLYTAVSEQKSNKVAGIRFFPDGTSTGGRVTASSGSHERLVDIDWLTGKVRILPDSAG